MGVSFPTITFSSMGNLPSITIPLKTCPALRLALFLDLAEDWVKTTFSSESTFNTICGYTDNIKILCSRLVVADALRRAIPSPELMSALRSETLRGVLTQKRSEIVRQIKAQVVGYLRSGSFNSRRLADIVKYIRLNERDFKEWHQSETAKLFASPIFRNEKKAPGYFF